MSGAPGYSETALGIQRQPPGYSETQQYVLFEPQKTQCIFIIAKPGKKWEHCVILCADARNFIDHL